ncbi:hypothetical protein SKAU_G00297570 [Synaphobranchus kaupii]|uniref:Phosphoinositide-interacting protein n=1 Tax=Synaphobranchus kaupii TaxID=118154 RepID=A0A9Q1EUZ7_SYNKA|nr:hypothetical protein SKAU_G00297570 [Synaphobranchus kaupii]
MAQIPSLARRGGGTGQWEEGMAVESEGVADVFSCGPDPSPTASTANPNAGPQLHAPNESRSDHGNGSDSQHALSHSFCYADVFGASTEEEMEAGGDDIPLGDRSQSQSNDRLTESTVFSLSQSESLWTTESLRSAWEIYQYPILLLATGGAVFICGFILSGLYFAKISSRATNILGPALLSIGLMVLVVGLVLVPITKENLKPPMKRPVSYYRPPQFNL